jgi:hypothetical protein
VALLEELAAYIEAIPGLGLSRAGGNLKLGGLPESPSRVLALVPAPGSSPTLVLDSSAPGWDRALVALWLRDAHDQFDAARDAAETVYAEVAKIANADLTGKRWLLARPTSPPFLLERDGQRRPVMAFNLRVERVP